MNEDKVCSRNQRGKRGEHADVAQLVAHHLAKVRVASSSLVIRSKYFGVPEYFGGNSTVDWSSG